MTQRKGEIQPAPALLDTVLHKGTRECPMVEPHARAICGIVRAREANRDRADAARRAGGEGQAGG